MKTKILLILIIFLAAFFRLYGLNWDQGFSLHPDERQIVMVTAKINFSSFREDSLNPHFFAYGSFPIYLLKATSNMAGIFNKMLTEYGGINLVGRVISAIADLGTVILIFFLGKKLFYHKVGLLASLFYTISVFPIQAAHFYAVDSLLTFFILATLYRLIIFYERPTKINALIVGFLFGLSLATKTSALVLFISFGAAFTVDFLLVFLKQPHRPQTWFPHLPKFFKRLMVEGATIIIITAITFIIFEPYALLDFREFWRQTLEQYQMTHDAFTFPYTLQYAEKIPYLYELKNIFLWGLGPFIATFSFLGTIFVVFQAMKQSNNRTIIILTFFWTYVLVVGNFAIGFMRYMLPLYPLLCLFAAVFFLRLYSRLPAHLGKLVASGYLLVAITWPLAFLNIYNKPNTRVLASEWINNNIPQNSTIGVEHWDDSLPLLGQQNYKIISLPLYDQDTLVKWQQINQQITQTDYLILASNRLYAPLMKLTNCQNLPAYKCYPLTANYYKKLFAGNLGFKKVAEFSVYPKLEVISWEFVVDDQSADESFTVYDHPRVMIFKKMVQ